MVERLGEQDLDGLGQLGDELVAVGADVGVDCWRDPRHGPHGQAAVSANGDHDAGDGQGLEHGRDGHQ
jgi:hypothetical protein